MKKADYILVGVVLILALISYIVLSIINNQSQVEDGIAVVYFKSDKILEIKLEDGSYRIIDPSRVLNIDETNYIYHVEGSNPYGVYIEYKDAKVRVIDEESPQHICQKQGWTNSTLLPLTCLPNNIVISIEVPDFELPPFDDITG